MNTTLIQFSVINQYNSLHWQNKVESHRTKSVDTEKKEYGQSSVTSAIEIFSKLRNKREFTQFDQGHSKNHPK